MFHHDYCLLSHNIWGILDYRCHHQDRMLVKDAAQSFLKIDCLLVKNRLDLSSMLIRIIKGSWPCHWVELIGGHACLLSWGFWRKSAMSALQVGQGLTLLRSRRGRPALLPRTSKLPIPCKKLLVQSHGTHVWQIFTSGNYLSKLWAVWL